MVYTFGEEAEIQEIFSKNSKKSIFHVYFLSKISKFSSFLERANFCMEVSSVSCLMEINRQLLISLNSSTNYSLFSAKF